MNPPGPGLSPGLKFIVDANVGRLTKWLRAMGYDAVFLRRGDDGDLVRRAIREGRAIVTKDRKLLLRRVIASGEVPVVPITSDLLEQQLQELSERVPLDWDRAFTRCMECNVELEPVERAHVREEVPPYVYRTQESFSRCRRCRRVYWPGTHWAHMRQVLAGYTPHQGPALDPPGRALDPYPTDVEKGKC